MNPPGIVCAEQDGLVVVLRPAPGETAEMAQRRAWLVSSACSRAQAQFNADAALAFSHAEAWGASAVSRRAGLAAASPPPPPRGRPRQPEH